MRYQLKQKLWSLTHDYTITDDTGAPAYIVKGRVLSFTDKLALLDTQGNELVTIQKKLLSLGTTYELYNRGQLSAVVHEKMFTLFHNVFSVDAAPIGPSDNDLVATGTFLSWEYTFTRQGQEVAHVSTKFFRMTDTYGVEIADSEDHPLILAATIIIDRCAQRKRQEQ